MVGYRWRCKNCANHDLCDARRNPISTKLSGHSFFCFNEPGIFKPMVKQMGASAGPTKKNKKKLKPNDKCFCGSGKKLKKCCKTAP